MQREAPAVVEHAGGLGVFASEGDKLRMGTLEHLHGRRELVRLVVGRTQTHYDVHLENRRRIAKLRQQGLRGLRPLDGASGVGCTARDGAAVEEAGDTLERKLRLVRKVRHSLAQERFGALAVARTADRRRESACGSGPRRTIGYLARHLVRAAEQASGLVVLGRGAVL